MSKGREEIPSPVKLEVRRRCGFGCVICGLPLYEYHHIVPYAVSRNHDPDNITLLCDRHHKEATNGLLPSANITEANLRPLNKRRNISAPFGLYFKSPVEVVIGGNSLATVIARDNPYAATAIRIDDVDIIGLRVSKSGELFLSVQVFSMDGFPILYVHENEIVYSVERPWDVEFKGKTLTIREEKRKILLRLRFDAPNRVSIVQGKIAYMGALIMVYPKLIAIANTGQMIRNVKVEGYELGLFVGDENKLRDLAACVVFVKEEKRNPTISEVEGIRRKAHRFAR